MTDMPPATPSGTDPYRVGQPDEHLAAGPGDCELCGKPLTSKEPAGICVLCQRANPGLAGALLSPANRHAR